MNINIASWEAQVVLEAIDNEITDVEWITPRTELEERKIERLRSVRKKLIGA